METSVLKVSNISKWIKKKHIIKDVSFDIKAGEVLGFLGPNGSGKSTTLRMIVGLSKASSGEINICGYSIEKDYVKAMSNVGCIIEGPDLYDYMSGYKNLEMLGNMSKSVKKKDIDEAVELVGMGNRIHDKVAIYSMGMKQRIGLAQALIHKPKLLILDEPTNGLDPNGIHEFRDIVKSLAREKDISVLVSSHLRGDGMISLIENEIGKFVLKRKLILISVLLLIFVSLFSYGQKYSYDRNIERFESLSGGQVYDWKSLTTQRLADLEKRSNNEFIPEDVRASLDREIEQLNYFIENDIDPITPTAAKFSVGFVEQGIALFIPLLIAILAADLVSGEFANRTIKILLTRAVPRWKVLLSKYIALIMMTTVLVFLIGLISTSVSYLFFRQWGFGEPVLTGFSLIKGELSSSSVISISRIQYSILIYSLLWFVSIVVASITLLISVVVDNTPSAIGILMASLIGGQFLQFFLSEWDLVKYFFVTNLDLTRYLTGSYQPIAGMNLNFSILVLSAWAIVSLVISFQVFNRKDVLV